MCEAQGWKTTGDKLKLFKRATRQVFASASGKEGVVMLLESKIGPLSSQDGISGHIRKFYTQNYSALDKFDRLWYEMKFPINARDWRSYFCWSLLHTAVVNARSAWCLAHGTRVPLKDFLRDLVQEYSLTMP